MNKRTSGFHRRPRPLAALAVLGLLLGLALCPAYGLAAEKLTLLVTSDTEGQVESRLMTTADGRQRQLGGMARLAAVIKDLKAERPGRVLATASGDDLQGPYYLTFHGRAIYAALAEAGMDVGTLGNHEFDLGPEVLAGALDLRPFPIVSSNLTLPRKSPLTGLFRRTVIIDTGRLKVGFLGLMTSELPMISQPGDSVFVSPDLTETAQEAVDELRDAGAQVVVCLSHLGLNKDRLLAGLVKGIDVISGGHTHILVPSGRQLYVHRPDGGRTVIVQTGNRLTHVGRLDLTVDLTGNTGRLTGSEWRLIPLDETVGEDPATARVVAAWRARMPESVPLAELTIPLDCRETTVRGREAAAGNLVADLVRSAAGAEIALVNGGNIRTDRIVPPGTLTSADVADMLPFGNRVVVLSLPGEAILRALEWSLEGLPTLAGRFLQVSGLRFKAVDGWVVEADVRDETGRWRALDIDRVYRVAVSDFLAKGGDGFAMLAREAEDRKRLEVTMAGAVRLGLSRMGRVAPVVEGRIELAPAEENTAI